jgi:phage repressor protein C with HTH and peptisase S24 domain
MSELDLSQSELARRVGISQAAIAKLLRGPPAGSKFLHRIAKELHTSPAFLTGETPDPGEDGLDLPTATTVAEQLDAVMLREVKVGFSMGGGSIVEEWETVQMVPFSRSWLRSLTSSAPANLIVARGDGDSMMPTILDQDLVIIDTAQKLPQQQDRIWAMSYGGFGMIKRLRMLPDNSLQINSDNAAVTPISAVDGEVSIVGRVVGIVRRI